MGGAGWGRAVVLAAGLTGWAAMAPDATAQPAPGSYGGGLVEFLMTGQAGRSPHAAPAPRYGRAGFRPAAATAPEAEPDPFWTDTPGSRAGRRYASLPADQGYGIAAPASPPRQVVAYPGGDAPGSIVIDTPGKFLYLVQPGGQALRYGIGVGRPGFTWAGIKTVSMKREWPDWRPPAAMLKRRPDLPRHMAGGPDNPLGARALYLGSSLYRIHGTNEPGTIGRNLSSGCIRMMNEDVVDLYNRVGVGTRVRVI